MRRPRGTAPWRVLAAPAVAVAAVLSSWGCAQVLGIEDKELVTPDGGGVSLVAMTGPMILLYGLSIVLAWLVGKKKDPAI